MTNVGSSTYVYFIVKGSKRENKRQVSLVLYPRNTSLWLLEKVLEVESQVRRSRTSEDCAYTSVHVSGNNVL